MISWFQKIWMRLLNTIRGNEYYPEIEKIKHGNNVWLISDTHFGHKNVFFWCRKSVFKNKHSMDHKIFQNWNRVVKPGDKVYFLGDFGRLSFRLRRKLHGNICYVKGNHDRVTYPRQRIVMYNGLTFLLIHNPNDYTYSFNGDWIIHGHTHGNTPFINKARRRINVSCEMINYTPISFREIIKQIEISSLFNGPVRYKVN